MCALMLIPHFKKKHSSQCRHRSNLQTNVQNPKEFLVTDYSVSKCETTILITEYSIHNYYQISPILGPLVILFNRHTFSLLPTEISHVSNK
jgi:hypothetical protein